jgi:hypothetical protein
VGRIVHIAEETDTVFDIERNRSDDFWTATFWVVAGEDSSIDGLSLTDAVAWAREHGDEIVLRIGDRAAGPPPDPLPQLVRRRLASEEWKDRTDADPPITWTVAMLVSPRLRVEEVIARRAELDAAAAAVGADAVSGEQIDTFIADVQAARAAGTPGFTTYGNLFYELRFDGVVAATEEGAVAAVEPRCRALEGWVRGGRAEPQGVAGRSASCGAGRKQR